MERRLKLLASHGVRNIEQYNSKVAQLRKEPRRLFEEEREEELEPLPYVLILIDELADLMMLERANVEECITRLAQMARAVGMHLVLATQRPSVDVITGLIKANFPSRISFRVATRVDSRTVLDRMGAEHLLGKGDMLFLPPGSSRLTRVHGAFVTEAETNRRGRILERSGLAGIRRTFLMAPPSEDEECEAETVDGSKILCTRSRASGTRAGKASTSTLQRRLRLGYGRAARILDMMQRDGIIGPPDGSKPREVLKRPDWLREIERSCDNAGLHFAFAGRRYNTFQAQVSDHVAVVFIGVGRVYRQHGELRHIVPKELGHGASLHVSHVVRFAAERLP